MKTLNSLDGNWRRRGNSILCPTHASRSSALVPSFSLGIGNHYGENRMNSQQILTG